MRDQIGQVAGEIWRILAEKGELSISQVSKAAKQKTEIAYQALGWLAREDKINYSSKDGKIFVSLAPSERICL